MTDTTVVTTGTGDDSNGASTDYAAGVAAATAAGAAEDATEATEHAERAEEVAESADRMAGEAMGDAMVARSEVDGLRAFVEQGFAELRAQLDGLAQVTEEVVEEVAEPPESTDDGDQDQGNGDGDQGTEEEEPPKRAFGARSWFGDR